MGNVNQVDEGVRKAVQSIRNAGSQMNMSIPPTRLKGEAIKLRDKCDELITMLGGE